MERHPIVLLALALAWTPSSMAAQESNGDPRGALEAARSISADDYAWKVGVIAHDSMGGRDTPSAGLDATAGWIASEFRRLGLRGGAEDGSFIQRYPVRSTVVDSEASWLGVGAATLRYGTDVAPLRGGSESVEVSGGIVVVSGAGSVTPAIGARVSGAHAILAAPPEAQRLDRRLFQLVVGLANAGAASVWVPSSLGDEAWAAQARRALRPSVEKGWGEEGRGGSRPAVATAVWVREAALASVLEGRGVELRELQARAGGALRVDEVPGGNGILRHAVRAEDVTAPNVVGILEGSDPRLREEHVVFSGHMDHVGIGAPDENGDSIFNGADDDASGTVAVMEVAEAMASLGTAPRRSMIFLLVSGEEKGLWGSEWYAENPSVPIDRLVANVNTDMVGRNWPDTIVAIGKEHSDLGETLDRVNAAHPELRMTAIDDLWPEENFYFRSDHYNFARKGVPILFFFNGTHDDYHGRDDEPDRIDAEKAARIARLVFYLGLEIGDADARPEWNPESYARIVSDRR